jgi:hypothetical protein
MFESDESKNNTRATTKARKPIAALISVLISVTSVLVSLSVVKTGDAAPIVYDKSGMDILCTQPGDVYSGCVNGQSICFGGDGKNIICDCKTGNCTTFTSTGKSNPNGTAINDLVTLKELQIIDGKLNNLTTKINNLASQQSALISGQNALANQVNGLDLACTTSDLVPLPSSTPTRGPGDFCRRDDQGRLLVRVHNQGGIDAGASTTRVAFGCAI